MALRGTDSSPAAHPNKKERQFMMGYVKSMFAKTSPEDLRAYLQFQRRGSQAQAKKGKGSFKRKSRANQF